MKIQSYKIGAMMYVIWGILHLKAAQLVYQLGQSLDPSMIQGRIYQDAGFLLFFGLSSICIAVMMNWKNRVDGYWINLISVTAVDILFIGLIVIPGYVPLWPGLLGPLFWVLALIFSTLGLKNESKVK